MRFCAGTGWAALVSCVHCVVSVDGIAVESPLRISLGKPHSVLSLVKTGTSACAMLVLHMLVLQHVVCTSVVGAVDKLCAVPA